MLRLTLCLTVILSLSACSTRLNPFNWFGNDRSESVAVTEEQDVDDLRPLVDQVIALSVDPTPQGAIVRATGLPPTQGYWQAELIEIERSGSSILYEFRVFPPLDAGPVSTQRSREVIVAAELSNFDLAGIRTITVTGAQNRRSVSRR